MCHAAVMISNRDPASALKPVLRTGMRYSLAPFVIIIALGGCAMSSGILPAGPNTYTLTERYAPLRGGRGPTRSPHRC
jgi:hypothetical protein